MNKACDSGCVQVGIQGIAVTSTFGPLLERVSLFQEIVNARFLFKDLSIDQESGFVFQSLDSRRAIEPDQLSSGEQHELVLLYQLLFMIEQDSLVLIDEPEISLHVGWQQEFLNDIVKVSEITGMRFIIATHSPQIINKWWDRTCPLSAQ